MWFLTFLLVILSICVVINMIYQYILLANILSDFTNDGKYNDKFEKYNLIKRIDYLFLSFVPFYIGVIFYRRSKSKE
jgi:hypothetical protein